MTGWYVLFWRSQQTKFGKQGIHTLEGLVGTTRRLCAVEIVDINIDRNSFIVQNMHDALVRWQIRVAERNPNGKEVWK